MQHETHIAQAIAALTTARSTLGCEIAAYPTPISGCDAQFTRLLSDRQRISDALTILAGEPFIPTPRIMEPGARVESR
ncbi:MAG: hypothetical protein AAGD12_04330 [Pseudomonadota bacterium]